MSNYNLVWNAWIFRTRRQKAAAFVDGHTADEIAAFDRAMARPAPLA